METLCRLSQGGESKLSDLGLRASWRSTQVVHCGHTDVSSSSIAKLDADMTDLGEITALLLSWRLNLAATTSPRPLRSAPTLATERSGTLS